VFAGDRAARVDAQFHDLLARGVNAFDFVGVAPVVIQVRMEIAVARVKDRREAQVILRADKVNPGQDVRQFRPGHDGVLYQQIGADASQRAESPFATGPQLFALGLVASFADGSRIVLEADFSRPSGLRLKSRAQSVEFDDQAGLGVARIAGRVYRIFHSVD